MKGRVALALTNCDSSRLANGRHFLSLVRSEKFLSHHWRNCLCLCVFCLVGPILDECTALHHHYHHHHQLTGRHFRLFSLLLDIDRKKRATFFYSRSLSLCTTKALQPITLLDRLIAEEVNSAIKCIKTRESVSMCRVAKFFFKTGIN